MGELDALRRPGEDDAVLADHGAAPQRGEAERSALARTGMAVTAAHRVLIEVDPAPRRRGTAEQQGGTGRSIHLLVMMHLENLDVELVVEGFRHAPRQRRQ